MPKIIRLPIYRITITLGDPDPKRPDTFLGGNIDGGELTNDLDPAETDYNAAIDGILSTILAHASAGIDVTTPAYVEGVETAADNIANKYT
ncbi:MAG: hypothetical protein FWD53_10440 [Phycisphaerales bacterium]|nr:hypothetical protein [Phycisphaerales bacterium]